MSRQVLQPFESYQKSRITFVQEVAELAKKDSNIELLYSAGAITLLKPLLMDSVSSIQQSSALALGRLANYSHDLAKSVIENNIISQLISTLSYQNRFFKKAACFVIRAVAKHSAGLAKAIVDANALDELVKCLEEFDPSVKEAAAWAIGYIAKHNAELASKVVNAKAVDSLIICLQEPEIALKRASALTLSYICQHSKQLAQPVVDLGLNQITFFLPYNDVPLKRNICLLLGNITKHDKDLSNQVMSKLDPQKLLSCLNENDNVVKHNAAFCLCKIAERSLENSQRIIENGGAAILVEFITNVKGEPRLYGILTLGFIASRKGYLASEIINAKAINQLQDALENETIQHIKAAACYALGHLGQHTPEHSKEVADANVLSTMLYHYMAYESTEDLKEQAKKALKKIIGKCTYLTALEPLLKKAPDNILSLILDQYVKHLKNSTHEKKQFIQNEGLKKLQELYPRLNSQLQEKIREINSYYPASIVKYYSPEFTNVFQNKLESNQTDE